MIDFLTSPPFRWTLFGLVLLPMLLPFLMTERIFKGVWHRQYRRIRLLQGLAFWGLILSFLTGFFF